MKRQRGRTQRQKERVQLGSDIRTQGVSLIDHTPVMQIKSWDESLLDEMLAAQKTRSSLLSGKDDVRDAY